MYKVPSHIKTLIIRIISEYELMLHQGTKIALQLFRDNRIYSGLETTQYYLSSAKHFLKLLETQEEYLSSTTENEFHKKVYQKICEFYKPLSEEAILRITNSSECQGQLEQSLRTAKKNPATYSDAKFLSGFISNACTQNWCSLDETLHHKVFKLIKDENTFENLLACDDKHNVVEITTLSSVPYVHFRVALETLSIEDCYRKQCKIREYRNFWDNHLSIEEFETDHIIFNLWNNISTTGIYYVYIPNL